MRTLFIGFSALVLLFVVLYLAAPIDPAIWKPPPNPGLAGEFSANNRLAQLPRVLEGIGHGPEGVACGEAGQHYTGLHDGRIFKFNDRGEYSELVNTGGRPLGMKVATEGNLIVADAILGLISVSPEGELKVLTDSVNGKRMLFVDDLDIADDGTIWFSDASARHGYKDNILDFFDGRPSGRLISYHPDTAETRVHLEDLFFANGVAMGPDDTYVLINETGTGRIHRLWLHGDKAGQRDLFHKGLPGTPDNITFNGTDTFWVAMPSLRKTIDDLADKPLLRRYLSVLPRSLLSANAGNYSFLVGLGLDGEVKHNLQDSSKGFVNITSAVECGPWLYIGSLTMPAVGRLPLSQLTE